MSLLFRQFFESESSTYTYLVADSQSQQAALIDPVKETMDRDLSFIKELGLKLKYIIETHVHADHITSAGPIRSKVGGEIVLGAATKLETADHLLADGEELMLGNTYIRAIATPGHTNGCTCFLIGPYVFTGDTLLIRGCGRTDFQEGDSSKLFYSVREKLFSLPDETLVCPGHDYKGRMMSSIAEEKQWNPRLNLNIDEAGFVQIMADLKLAEPKKIAVAVPANMKSGL